MYTCPVPDCSKTFDSAGTQANHSKSCAARYRKDQAEASILNEQLQAAAPARPPPVQRKPWEAAGRTEHVQAPRRSKPHARTGENRAAPPQASSSRNPPLPRTGTIRVEYPPNLKRKPEYLSRDEYQSRHEKKARKAAMSFEQDPWHPFKTRSDFDFAELVLKAQLSKDQISSLLTVVQRCIGGKDALTFEGYADLHASWEEARHLVEPFAKHDVEVPFAGDSLVHEFWCRSLWDWAVGCLKNKQLINHFRWDAERLQQFNGKKWERVVDDPWTGDDWFNIQGSLPDGGIPLAFILYADKTMLSTFGAEKGYPVYAKLANLPSEMRNGTGLGGGRVVGWLPVVKDDAKYSGDSGWVDYKRVVWHDCFKVLLSSLSEYSRTGCYVRCGDGVVRRFFPCILILSADYEEQIVMANTRGLKTAHPCPVCLVPKEALSEYCDEWEYRDPEATLRLAMQANDESLSQDERMEAVMELEEQGFRPHASAFSTVANSNVHRALSFDRLHNYPSGLGKSHVLPLAFNLFGPKSKKILKLKSLAEERAAAFPRWRGLHHFSKILTEKAYQDANKWEDIARVLLYILPDIFPARDRLANQIVKLLRSFLNLNAYSSFERHTESSIEGIRSELRIWAAEVEAHGKLDKEKHWNNAPKVHMHMHMPGDIMAKGATRHYNTKTFESMHRPLKQFYLWMTNFRNVAPQILEADTKQFGADFIAAEIEAYDELVAADRRALAAADDGPDEPAEPLNVFGHVTMRAPTAAKGWLYSSFKFSPADIAPYAAVVNPFKFKPELAAFLAKNGDEVPYQADGPSLRIQVFQTLEITYPSRETQETDRNLLRCRNMFHGAPRFDAVIINTTKGPLFARLLYAFALRSSKDDPGVAIVLALPYDGYVPPAQRKRDENFGLLRVAQARSAVPEFFLARTVSRGALLAPAGASATEFYVVDVIDADMFLRVREIRASLAPPAGSDSESPESGSSGRDSSDPDDVEETEYTGSDGPADSSE